MSGIVNIARCQAHGLHGERGECYVCGGPVEQVPMIPAGELRRLAAVWYAERDPELEVARAWEVCNAVLRLTAVG